MRSARAPGGAPAGSCATPRTREPREPLLVRPRLRRVARAEREHAGEARDASALPGLEPHATDREPAPGPARRREALHVRERAVHGARLGVHDPAREPRPLVRQPRAREPRALREDVHVSRGEPAREPPRRVRAALVAPVLARLAVDPGAVGAAVQLAQRPAREARVARVLGVRRPLPAHGLRKLRRPALERLGAARAPACRDAPHALRLGSPPYQRVGHGPPPAALAGTRPSALAAPARARQRRPQRRMSGPSPGTLARGAISVARIHVRRAADCRNAECARPREAAGLRDSA